MQNKLTFFLFLLIIISSLNISFAQNDEESVLADTVFLNGSVYRVTDFDPWASSIAIKDGLIIHIGNDEDARRFISSKTKIVDLNGKMLMPGFQDSHVHPVDSGMTYNQCAVFNLPILEDLLKAIKKCVEDKPNAKWIVGAGWNVSTFAPSGVPQKKLLDEITTDIPISLLSNAAHTVWANSAAIQAAGINASTPDPDGGKIDRDALTGEPIGGFQETAMPLIQSFEPPITIEERVAGLAYAQKLFHSYGITGVHDSYVEISRKTAYSNMDAYTTFADSGKLKMHVVAAMLYDPSLPLEPQIKLFNKYRESADRENVKVSAIKILVDGVATSYTAAMLEPYSDRVDEHFLGKPLVSRDDLIDLVTRLDAMNFQMHFHSIGDAATHYSLDALEAAIEINGRRDSRHHLSHIEVWDPDDYDRMANVNAIANFQALWATKGPMYDEITLPRMGEDREKYMYPIRSLHERGVTLAFGSDWYVTSANPLHAIEVAITRIDPDGLYSDPLVPEEAIDLATAIKAATLGSTYGNFLDHKTGSLEIGKLADVIVLDKNLFEIPAKEISETKVILTMFGGEVVYGDLEKI